MGNHISYQRSRFSTQLPADRRYTPSHCWLLDEGVGIWRVGFTQFATWLLGDPVEFEFSVRAGSAVGAGQEIGWVEGLKAVTTIYSAVQGEFLDAGEEISADITVIESDPYERGWLYRVRGEPAPESMDVQAYIALLDEAVEEELRSRQDECRGGYAG